MWRTHAWHHSVEQMYWFAGFRTSFFHSFIYNIPQVVVPVTLLKLTPAEAGIGYSIGLLIQFWEHTNLKVNIGPLAWLIVTPDYHRIHHSATTHRGMNLAPTFRLWDRMFGTYVDPATMPAEFPLGLGEHVDEQTSAANAGGDCKNLTQRHKSTYSRMAGACPCPGDDKNFIAFSGKSTCPRSPFTENNYRGWFTNTQNFLRCFCARPR